MTHTKLSLVDVDVKHIAPRATVPCCSTTHVHTCKKANPAGFRFSGQPCCVSFVFVEIGFLRI
jgi:hypothetical protein